MRDDRSSIFFMISIDTEEDQWDNFNEKATVKNVECIANKFHPLCEKYDIKPTYLVNSPVVESVSSKKIIQELANSSHCEIGMHLHPWRTSPHRTHYQFPKHSHITNYSYDMIGEKIKKLFHELQNVTQKSCRTFRAGRWSMSFDAMDHLFQLGVTIDSSITPYTSWKKDGGNDFSTRTLKNYKFLSPNFLEPNENGNAYEVPPTIGWTRGNLHLMGQLEKLINKLPAVFRAKGILHHLNIVKKVWLSPEQTSNKDMIQLSQNLIRNNSTYLHAMFHSTSLLPGLSPFIQTQKDLDFFYARLENLFQYVQSMRLHPVTISEFVDETYLF